MSILNCMRGNSINKLEQLKSNLRKMESAAIAYSGGVDSTFLINVAHEVLGEKAIAVTATSSTYPRRELEQAKKELAEANDLLIEMRIELNNWKSNIIGFRDEMRDADKYQLEALLKILKVLGGEVNTDKSQGQGQDSNAQPQIGQSELTSK